MGPSCQDAGGTCALWNYMYIVLYVLLYLFVIYTHSVTSKNMQASPKSSHLNQTVVYTVYMN